MSANEPAVSSLVELERLLQTVDAGVRLVPPRILRRVIKRVARVPGLGLQVPHRKSFICSWAAYAGALDGQPAGLAPPANVVILLEAPSPRDLVASPRQAILARYWRLLFHAHVHCAVERRIEAGQLSLEALGRRLRAIGGAFDEIRTVLAQEKLLLVPEDDREVYKEFAAVYLELRSFAPAALPFYFPALAAHDVIDRLLAEDVDAAALLAQTRPPGATAPGEHLTEDESHLSVQAPSRNGAAAPATPPASGIGNSVRTAIEHLVSAADESALPAAARTEMDRLAERLGRALRLDAAEVTSWSHALSLLVGPAARGVWSPERRLLYDLQRVCLDCEREVYALDLVDWLVSGGRRPVRRLLPGQGDVLALKHLRRAWRRVPAAALAPSQRFALAALLEAAIGETAERVRERFRPRIHAVLEEVGLRPQSFPERLSRNKLTEELLDRVVSRGFLNVGDLRDALSRNQLKLPDLAGAAEWLGGDPLLRADRAFANQLDGVYRRGEVYLRGLQRLSSVAFGTAPGRFLTRFVALPLGGAFFLLEGLQHFVEPVVHLFARPGGPPVPDVPPVASDDPADSWMEFVDAPPAQADAHQSVHLLNGYSFVAVSLFLFALLHFPAFRAWCGAVAVRLMRRTRWLLVDLPYAVLHQPLVRGLLASPPVRWCLQYLVKPLAVTLPVTGLLALLRAGPWLSAGVSAGVFAAAAVLVNSRFGRDLEESLSDWLVRTWRQVHTDLVPGILWWVAGVFKRFLESSERVLYAVDEWLRFRAGDSRWALYVKPVLGLAWFMFTYLIRIFINLFIEPTVNPIKHFPVVTVAAKLIVPIIPDLGRFLTGQLQPLAGRTSAGLIAALVIFFLPGLAGFLVWEFKENWKLYRANRPCWLRPAVIGHHGETMLRLLRPGFHSGTLPKLFAKLRKALRQAQRRGTWRSFRKQREALHEVEESLRHFLERELLFLLNESKTWTAPHVSVGAVDLCTNRISAEVACPALASDPLRLAFALHDGQVLASVEDAGWLPLLPAEQRQLVGLAVAGLYRLSAASGAREIAWGEWVAAWDAEEGGRGLAGAMADPLHIACGERECAAPTGV